MSVGLEQAGLARFRQEYSPEAHYGTVHPNDVQRPVPAIISVLNGSRPIASIDIPKNDQVDTVLKHYYDEDHTIEITQSPLSEFGGEKKTVLLISRNDEQGRDCLQRMLALETQLLKQTQEDAKITSATEAKRRSYERMLCFNPQIGRLLSYPEPEIAAHVNKIQALFDAFRSEQMQSNCP